MAIMSRSLISRLSPYFSARLRRNSRLLSSSSAPALREPRTLSPETPSESPDDLHLTYSCVRRIKELQADEGHEKLLRLSIEAGGCSGFQYKFSLDDTVDGDDRVFEQDGVKVVVDKISHGFVKGATVDFAEELIRSAFQIFGKLYAEPIISILLPNWMNIGYKNSEPSKLLSCPSPGAVTWGASND